MFLSCPEDWAVLFPSYCFFFLLLYRFYFLINILFIYFQREGKGGRKEGEKHQYVVLSHTSPTATQACALTGNQTGDPLVHRPALSPLSHVSQGVIQIKKKNTKNYWLMNIRRLILLSPLISICFFFLMHNAFADKKDTDYILCDFLRSIAFTVKTQTYRN